MNDTLLNLKVDKVFGGDELFAHVNTPPYQNDWSINNEKNIWGLEHNMIFIGDNYGKQQHTSRKNTEHADMLHCVVLTRLALQRNEEPTPTPTPTPEPTPEPTTRISKSGGGGTYPPGWDDPTPADTKSDPETTTSRSSTKPKVVPEPEPESASVEQEPEKIVEAEPKAEEEQEPEPTKKRILTTIVEMFKNLYSQIIGK